MIQHKRAADLRKGDRLVLQSKRIDRECKVQAVRSVPIADLLPEDCAPYAREGEMIALDLCCYPGIPSRDFEGKRMNFCTIHLDPDDPIPLA